MYRVRKQIGCDQVSYTGRHIHVVYLDTGVCTHPDIRDRIEGFRDFVGSGTEPYDDNGHGTHVVGCLAGSGSVSRGRYRGIAPESSIWCGKILDQDGNGELCNLLKAMEWIVTLLDTHPIHIVNISVGAGNLKDSPEFRYLTELIQFLVDKDVFIFCAAGNFSADMHMISILGKLEGVVTVGCHEGGLWQGRMDLCQNYSCLGDPNATGIKRKPDLVAPGTDIISCNAHYKIIGTRVWNAYCKKSGTSMATPIAAGAAALYKEKFPRSTVHDYKRAIAGSCKDLGLPFYQQGFGMLNIPRLLQEKES